MQEVELGLQLPLLNVAALLRPLEDQQIVCRLVFHIGFELQHLLLLLLDQLVLLLDFGVLLDQLILKELDDLVLVLVGLLQLLNLLVVLRVVLLDVRHNLFH